MTTLITRKKLGVYKIMRNTVLTEFFHNAKKRAKNTRLTWLVIVIEPNHKLHALCTDNNKQDCCNQADHRQNLIRCQFFLEYIPSHKQFVYQSGRQGIRMLIPEFLKTKQNKPHFHCTCIKEGWIGHVTCSGRNQARKSGENQIHPLQVTQRTTTFLTLYH